MSWVTVGIVGGGVLSGIGSFLGGSSQASAAKNAQNISLEEFKQITGQEQPYMSGGYGGLSQLEYLLGIPNSVPGKGASSSPAGVGGSLLKPFTVNDFQSLSPAYKFQLEQGKQGVLNGDASSAGALSGSAQKDLMGYNQNLANTAFNNAFNMYQTQQGNIFQRLAGIAQLGQSATSNTGQQGTALAGQAAQSAQNYGTAMGGAISGAAGSIGGAASSLPWLYAFQNGGGGGGGGGWSNPA